MTREKITFEVNELFLVMGKFEPGTTVHMILKFDIMFLKICHRRFVTTL